MISTTIIKDLIIYFARFVPVRVRKEMLKQPQNTRFAGYEEVKADILESPGSTSYPGLRFVPCFREQ